METKMRTTTGFKGLSIDLVNEWGQLLGKYNWVDFHLIMLRIEKENIHGLAEIELYLLGFGIRFYWTWNKKMMDEKFKKYNDLVKNGDWYELKRVDKK
jgi:hypothetical protein